MYERMGLVRELEDRLKTLVERGVPMGPVHFYTGQEAVAVGVCAALRQDDWIASTHRGHGHCVAKGVEVRRMLAELYGKSTGTNRGKGGSMHITDVSVGMLGVNPIVGMGTPHAVGAALSARVRGTDQVAVAFFGEGAASMGVVHEAMNLASVWRLPVVFVCENNGYAISQRQSKEMAVDNVADRAAGYGMPGEVVDGNDLIAVYGAMRRAVERARRGDGPTLLEAKTYRLVPHSSDDDDRIYRSREEVAAWRRRDPLTLFRSQLTDLGVLDEPALQATTRRVAQEVDDATAYAEEAPSAPPQSAFTHVYADAA
jgi:pyruvate dehydrogenase E1 component alpha subunit